MSHWDSVEAERARAYEDALIEVQGWLANPSMRSIPERDRHNAACSVIHLVLLAHSDNYPRPE